jgi:hypothetical protein
MGHIKEPEDVDFVIDSRTLTKEEEIAISDYIRAYKAKHSQKKVQSKRTTSKKRKFTDPLMKK